MLAGRDGAGNGGKDLGSRLDEDLPPDHDYYLAAQCKGDYVETTTQKGLNHYQKRANLSLQESVAHRPRICAAFLV